MISCFSSDLDQWAENTFRGSCPEDRRLSPRLIRYAKLQAADPKGSTARVCGGDKAAQMGAYRFLENPRVKPSSIDLGPCAATARVCQGRARLLCIQDTTSVSVASAELREELASTGSPTGFAAHTAMMVDRDSGDYLGAISQERWLRKGHQKRFEGSTESEKWGIVDAEVKARIDGMNNVIFVADPEADILPFTQAKLQREERFVIRARHDRRLWQHLPGLFDAARIAPKIGLRDIIIEQRGAVAKKGIEKGRSARSRRTVRTTLQARQTTIVDPTSAAAAMTLNVVRVAADAPAELTGGEGSFEWLLLTTESVNSLADVVQVVKDYEHRWIIQELHKIWKTGCRLEERPLQTVEAVETMMAITLPIAGRLLQLTTAARNDDADFEAPTTLDDEEVRCVWAATEKKPFPTKKPTAKWAILAIARLGGWYDSKRTGRVGWQTLWHGWGIFSQRLSGWRDARASKSL